MTGLFPFVLVQILWRRTRCLSVWTFSAFIQSAFLFPLVLLKTWRMSCFGKLFVSFFASVIVVGSVLPWFATVNTKHLQLLDNLGLLYYDHDLWWVLSWSDKLLIKHVTWPQAHPPAVIHVAFAGCFYLSIRYFPPMVTFSCFILCCFCFLLSSPLGSTAPSASFTLLTSLHRVYCGPVADCILPPSAQSVALAWAANWIGLEV